MKFPRRDFHCHMGLRTVLSFLPVNPLSLCAVIPKGHPGFIHHSSNSLLPPLVELSPGVYYAEVQEDDIIFQGAFF